MRLFQRSQSVRAIVLQLSVTTFLILAMQQSGFARERGPRVEVVCPSPPIAVKLGDQRVLVYELHVTNFDAVPLTLKSVEIFADPGKGDPLKTLSGDALAAAMVEAGAMSSAKDSQTIGAAKRVVLFLWVDLGLDTKLPDALRHRMVFVADDAGSATPGANTESTLDFPVTVSRDEPLRLDLPFEGGVWFAGEGPGNDSGHRRSIIAIDGHIHDAQRFAIDWAKVGPNADSHHDGTARNENWWGYGEPILAVADGEVTGVLDGIPENTPRVLPKEVTLDNIAGNYVILRVAQNRYVTYAHLQNGSIKVALHDHVSRGTVIARLGNTGQATAPHLHFQLTDANSVLESEGVPFIIASFTDLGPGANYELDKHLSIPRTNSIPGKDEVVEFPGAKK